MQLSIFNTLTESDPGLFIWMSAIFCLFWFMVYRAGYRPLMDSLGARNSEIQNALDEAAKAKAEMQNLKAENDRLLAAAKAEQAKILAEAKSTRETIVTEAKAKAQEEANKIMASATQEIENQKKAAIAEVKNESGLVALAIAEKVIRKQLTENADQDGLMDKLIDEIKLN